jgi:predicted esterase
MDLMQAMLSSYGMTVGKGLEESGFESVGKWLFSTTEELYEKNIEAASQTQRKRYEETEGFGEKAEWFVETVKEQSLMTGVPIAVGFGGRALVSLLMATPHPLVKAAGFAGAAALSSYILQTGEAYSSQLEKGGRTDKSAAHLAGSVAALLDVITPTWLFGGGKIGRLFKRNIAEKIFSGSNVGKKILAGAMAWLSEGETEKVQEMLMEASVNFANDLPLWEFDEEQKEAIREAQWTGRYIGGGMGIALPRGTYDPGEVSTPEAEAAPVVAPEAPVVPPMARVPEAMDPTVDYDIPPSRRGVERPTIVEGEQVTRLKDVLNARLSQLEAGEVPPVHPTIAVSRLGEARPLRRTRTLEEVQRTPSELAGLSLPATRRRRIFPSKVPPITKPIPDDSAPVDLNTGVDAALDEAYNLNTRRPLSNRQKDILAKYGTWENYRKAKEAEEKATADIEKEVETVTLKTAVDVAAEDFDIFMADAGDDVTVAFDRMVNRGRQIRRQFGAAVEEKYRAAYLKRQSQFEKEKARRDKAAGIKPPVVPPIGGGERAPGTDKPSPPAPDLKEDEVAAATGVVAEEAVILGKERPMVFTNDHGVEIGMTELEDGTVEVMADGKPLSAKPYISERSARRAARDITPQRIKTRDDRAAVVAANKARREAEKLAAAERSKQAKIQREEAALARAKAKEEADRKAAADAEAEKKRIAERERLKEERTVAPAELTDEEVRAQRKEEIETQATEQDIAPTPILKQKAAERSAAGPMTAAEKKKFRKGLVGIEAVAKANKYQDQYKGLNDEGRKAAQVALTDAQESWEKGDLTKEAIKKDWTWKEFRDDAVVGDIDLSLEEALFDTISAEAGGTAEPAVVEEDVVIDEAFMTDEEIKEAELARKKKAGPDKALQRPKKKTKAGVLPTEMETVVALDPEKFLKLVNNMPAEGGYSLPQLRKLAKQIPAVNERGTRPEIVTGLKLWYGNKNNVDESVVFSDEEMQNMEQGDYEAIYDETFDDEDGGLVFTKARARFRLPEELQPIEQGQVESLIVSEMTKIFGTEATRNMLGMGFINFGTLREFKQSFDSVHIDAQTAAFVSQDSGKVYFVTDVIPKYYAASGLRGIILHEIGVHFGKGILTKSEWANVKAALLDMYVRQDPAIVKAYNRASDQVTHLYGPNWNEHALDTLWNETLAYYASQNPGKIRTGPSEGLWKIIERGVRRFFKKLLLKFNPRFKGLQAEITTDDIEYLIAHMTWHVPQLALKRHGDSKKKLKLRRENRARFLKDSVVQEPVYHADLESHHFPVFAVSDLGYHFGTLKSAEERIDMVRRDWIRKHADEITDDQLFVPESDYIGKYYISLKNPLEITSDFQWKDPSEWYKYTFEDQDVSDFFRNHKQWRKFIGGFDSIMPVEFYRMSEDKKNTFYDKFRQEFTAFWKDQGYDGLYYTNTYEDPGEISWMVFDEEQIASAEAYSFNPISKGILLSREIGGTEADNVAGNRKAALDAEATVANTHKAIGVGRSAWQSLHRFFDPFATVGARELLLKARYAARGESTIGENMAKNIFDIFEEATPAEKEVIYKYFTTRNANPDMLPDRDVKFKIRETIFLGRRKGSGDRQIATANLKQKTIEVKKQIEDLGQAMVDIGLVPEFEARYERLKGKYLPKMYLKYLLGDEYKRALGGGMRAGRLDYTKIRKLHSEWAAKILLGEIKDPGFLASKYVGTVTHDLAMVNYLNYVVSDPANQGWVLPRGRVKWRGQERSIYWLEAEATDLMHRADIQEKTDPDTAKKMRELAAEMRDSARKAEPDVAGYDMKNYRQIPNHPKFGGMRGLYVKKEIYDDVEGWAGPTGEQPVIAEIFSRQGWGGVLQRTFKYTRVIANPPTLIRNIGSNTILLHTSGVSMFKIPYVLGKAMTEILNNGKYYRVAQEQGIETTSFSHEELRGIDREFAKLQADASLMDKFKIFLSDANVGGRFYQKSEVLFKVAKIIDGMENKGLSESDAALEAQEAILDYSLVSPSVRFLRSVPFGAPFITFQVKVLPQLLKNLRKHPMSFAPYVALPYIMAGIFASENDVDQDDVNKLKKHMSEWARDRSGIHFLPSKDENGKWVAIDIGYMLPWTAWYETARDMQQMEFGDGWRGAGFFTGPIDILKGFESNIDPFTQQPIWNELDPPQQQYQDMMIFLASYMVPPFMNPRGRAGGVTTGGGPAVKLLMAAGLKDGNIGEDGLPKYTIPASIMSMFGLNTYTLSPNLQLARNIEWMTRDLEKTEMRMMQLISEPGISDDKREQLAEEYVVYIQNKWGDIQEYVESLEGMSEKLK